jgi:hypothetical protein
MWHHWKKLLLLGIVIAVAIYYFQWRMSESRWLWNVVGLHPPGDGVLTKKDRPREGHMHYHYENLSDSDVEYYKRNMFRGDFRSGESPDEFDIFKPYLRSEGRNYFAGSDASKTHSKMPPGWEAAINPEFRTLDVLVFFDFW